MQKILSLIGIALFLTITTIIAQTADTAPDKANVAPWKFSINSSLTMGLNSYSDNWVGGEAGSFSWAAQMAAIAERQFNASINNKNTLKLAFGQTKTQDKTTKRWSMPQKSTDLIDFETVLKFTLGGFADPFISGRAISEFLDGSDTLLIRYGNPLDITEALGGSRDIVKNDRIEWAARLGVAARQLVDRQKLVAGERKTDMTYDGGLEFVTDFKASNAAKWALYTSTLKVYEALLSSKAKDFTGDASNDWRYPNVNWENNVTLNITKYIMVNGTVQFLYDRPIDKNWRIKETLAAGLTYMFSSAK